MGPINMKITKRQLRKIIREAIRDEWPEKFTRAFQSMEDKGLAVDPRYLEPFQKLAFDFVKELAYEDIDERGNIELDWEAWWGYMNNYGMDPDGEDIDPGTSNLEGVIAFLQNKGAIVNDTLQFTHPVFEDIDFEWE